MPTGYSAKLRRAGWLAFGIALLSGAMVGVMVRFVAPGAYFWLVFPALLAICALALWACVSWWNRLDDMQKQGQLVSWYWGGVGGGVAMLMGLVAASGLRSEMANGALLMMLGQVVGFLVWWAFWAWNRRGPQA